ncbi:MAG: hypothetical protein QGD94_03380, partial [Planctomycetia bacterium]|nr:hypothetical protein [Planctomycetia bacterium]
DSWQFLVYPTAAQVYALSYRYQVQTGKFATPISSGSGTFSNTTVDFDSITDSSATFSTDGVVAGDKVVVVSAASAVAGIHEVASVTSETQIKLTTSPAATDASACTYDVYDDIIYHKGGRMHDQTVVEMCMAVAEERHMEGVTVHRQLASRQLMRSIGRDKRFTAQQIGGSLGRRSPLEPPVTYVSNID